MFDKVYLLWHTHELDVRDEELLLGVYSEKRLAEEAQIALALEPGFRDHPDGFEIAEYTLNQRHWTKGFVTVSTEHE